MAENAPEKPGLPDFSKKVGPLPTWGWAVIVIGAYFVYRHISAGRTVAASTADAATDPTALIDGNMLGGSGSASSGLGSTSTASLSDPPTNQAWGLTAIQALIGGAAYKPGDVTTAITKYLSGDPLSTLQQKIVNDALKNGPPPTPVPLVTIPQTQDISTDFYGNQTKTIFDTDGNVVSQTAIKYVSPAEFQAEQAVGKAPGVYDPTGGFYDPGTPTPVPGT
jgi:hypothetical protein